MDMCIQANLFDKSSVINSDNIINYAEQIYYIQCEQQNTITIVKPLQFVIE